MNQQDIEKLKEMIDTTKYIRFIKLGEKGKFETKCLEDESNMVLGFREVKHTSVLDKDLIRETYLAQGKSKQTASSYYNQIEKFYDEDTLWITFYGQKLWWGFADNSDIKKDDENYTFKKMRLGWYPTDLKGNPLTFENISGVLLKTQMYQGTICDIKNKEDSNFKIENYIKRLLKGEKLHSVIEAEKNIENMKVSIINMIQLLQPKDFEYLIDLIFQYSGWKKLTQGGGVEKWLDLDLLMPLTNERAFVQIKSETTQKEYDDHEAYFYNCDELYNRMFYVVHTLKGKLQIHKSSKPIHILEVESISELVIELGLINILMKKVG